MVKRLTRSPAVQRALGRAIGVYMRFVDATTRWEEIGEANMQPYWRNGRPVVIAIWHGRLMQMHKSWPKTRSTNPGSVLISQSREGEIVAAATKELGYHAIRGSSAKTGKAKGALAALRDMLARLGRGETIAVTPDGPKGPRMRATLGVVQLARLSGAPIVPVAWAKQRAIVADSWDRFVFPLPFGRGVFAWGAPISVARDADPGAVETARLALEAALNRLTAEVDARVGRAETAPASPRAAAGEPEAEAFPT